MIHPSPTKTIILGVLLSLLLSDERQPFAVESVAEIFSALFGWDVRRALEEINACLALCERERERLPDWHKDENGLIRFELPTNLDYGLETLDLVLPEPRRIIAFALTMAWLVPAERREMAVQSLAPLLADLFGWDEQTVGKEITICDRTWVDDGLEANCWRDSRGYFHVGLPRRTDSQRNGSRNMSTALERAEFPELDEVD
jgi:hypothetical protein